MRASLKQQKMPAQVITTAIKMSTSMCVGSLPVGYITDSLEVKVTSVAAAAFAEVDVKSLGCSTLGSDSACAGFAASTWGAGLYSIRLLTDDPFVIL